MNFLKRTKTQHDFNSLVSENTDWVWNVCIGILQHTENTEDVVQDVFLKAYEHWETYKGEASPRTWLHRIAVNACYEFLRNRKRKKRDITLNMDGDITDFTIEDVFSLSPLGKLEQDEEVQLVREAIDALPANQLVVYQLAKMEDKSYQEIADATGFSVSAVESLMFRAKRNLQKMLENYYRT